MTIDATFPEEAAEMFADKRAQDDGVVVDNQIVCVRLATGGPVQRFRVEAEEVLRFNAAEEGRDG